MDSTICLNKRVINTNQNTYFKKPKTTEILKSFSSDGNHIQQESWMYEGPSRYVAVSCLIGSELTDWKTTHAAVSQL